MTKDLTLQQFVVDAANTLRETEQSLHELAQQALSKHKKLNSDSLEGDSADRFQEIGRQLAKLSERSHALHRYLQNGLDSPPVDDTAWPRIRILQSQEEERALLARELENSLGQLLANAVFELASCRHLQGVDNEAMSQGLDALQQELETGLTDVRHFIMNLEPATILNNFGLGEGVRRYLERFENRTAVKTKLLVKTNIGRLPSIIEIAIFRVIQEALLNVERHAGANQVTVTIEEHDNLFDFIVTDDGQGFASDRAVSTKRNLGLARMVDYADLLDGKLRIYSEPGQGTQVTLSVPYHAY